MNNKKRFFIIAAVSVLLCAGLVAAAAFNVDAILRKFSPELYLGYMAVNTMEKIEQEKEMIEEAIPEIRSLSDSHMMTLVLDTEKHKLKLTEDYNDDKPSVVFNGDYNGTAFEGYINNSETAVSLPDLLNVYFTFSTPNFGDEYIEGGGNELFPIGIPKGLDLTLPSDNDGDIIKKSELINIGKTLADGAEITHDEGDDYFLLLKSENVKRAFKMLADSIKGGVGFSALNSRISSVSGISLENDILNAAVSAVEGADWGDTLAVEYTQRKNYISRIKADIKTGESVTSVLLEGRGARLLEDYTVSVMSETNSSKIGFEFNENGSRMFKNEEKEDKKELKIIFGGEELLRLSSEMRFDKSNTSADGKISVKSSLDEDFGLSANIRAVPADGGRDDDAWERGVKLNADGFTVNGKETAGGLSAEIYDISNMQINEREKFPFKDLKLGSLNELSELIKGVK